MESFEKHKIKEKKYELEIEFISLPATICKDLFASFTRFLAVFLHPLLPFSFLAVFLFGPILAIGMFVFAFRSRRGRRW